MKILLFCHLGQIREYAQYIEALRKVDSVETLFLTMGQEESDLGREVGVFDVVKDILPEETEINGEGADAKSAVQELKELEDRLGETFVNRDILADRWFLGRPRLDLNLKSLPLVWTGSRTKQFMRHIYKCLESEIMAFQPDFMFVETSFAPTRMAWRLAREKGIPAGGFMSVRFWPERMYLETGIGYDWQGVRDAYEELNMKPMSQAERIEVTERLRTFIAEKSKPAYLKTDHAKGSAGFFRKLFATRTFSGHGSWLGERAKTFMRHPQVSPRKIFSPFAKFARYKNGLAAKKYLLKHQTPFNQIRKKRYAVYFLHVEPEITVEGMAFDYQNQVSTLKSILGSLPADMDLVVKEHSPMLGYRPIESYSELAHMPGLIFANTAEDSHQLITNAAVVVTLTGTVALEAILYGVPAVVLGSIYFAGFTGVYKPNGMNELRVMLSNPDSLSGASENDALRTLAAMYRASVLGVPPRVDVTVKEVELDSARAMMSVLKKACISP